MIDWTTSQGRQALIIIEKEKENDKSFREIASLLNSQNILGEIVTSEQVRSAKRYHIDKQKRVKSKKRTADERIKTSLILSDETKTILSLFSERMPVVKENKISVPKSKSGTTARSEEAVLMLSGCNVKDELLNSRIGHITKEVKRLHYKQTASSRIETLHIFMLGDIVLGMDDYMDMRYADVVNEARIDRMYKAVNRFAEMLLNLLINFKHIHISAICNTISRKGINWDILFYKALEQTLINYKSRIHFNISEDNWMYKNIYKSKFLLIHESHLDGKEYYSARAYEISKSFGMRDKGIDYLCTSNHHDKTILPNTREHLQNGSLKQEKNYGHRSYDEYQYLFGVDIEGLTWRYKI